VVKIDRQQLAEEAKAIVALAFRNGPIEDVHAGRACPTCNGHPDYSGITDAEMRSIMQFAVNHVFVLLQLKIEQPEQYEAVIRAGRMYTTRWDEPDAKAASAMRF